MADLIDLNAHIPEHFRRTRTADPIPAASFGRTRSSACNPQVGKYVRESDQLVTAGSWLSRPEVPTAAEILDEPEDGFNEGDNQVEIQPNIINGPWQSKEQYLQAHYELIREDAVHPLRDVVAQLKRNSHGLEDEFVNSAGIYDKVHIVGILFSSQGIAIRVSFSIGRAGKRVRWEQSKRLLAGSLVALSPTDDAFNKRCVVATVAARPLSGLEQSPPEIDLFFAKPEDIEIDPQMEWIMVEERSSFFEAHRHTLRSLQKMMQEPFPLAEHLVEVKQTVEAPDYLVQQPFVDLTSIFPNTASENFDNVDVLRAWPKNPPTELDKTQLRALHRILTKKVAIIQGPPGTGKTHVSVQALKVLVDNHRLGDSPIVVACQTNHALDQLLRHIAPFTEDFVRLGGRSKDLGVVKQRTLYNIRQGTTLPRIAGGVKHPARKAMEGLTAEMTVLLEPLGFGQLPQDNIKFFKAFGLLSDAQSASLETVQVLNRHGVDSEGPPPMNQWLHGAYSFGTPRYAESTEKFGYDFEEVDLEVEQLKEADAENQVVEDDLEELKGKYVNVRESFVVKDALGIGEKGIQDLLENHENMWKIPSHYRGSVYCYLRRRLRELLLTTFRRKAKEHQRNVTLFKQGRWEEDAEILKNQKIIGLTTTGLSKYRPLVSSLSPKIVLIEEAAETLESPVTAACVKSLQHLILVGDHLQLRPQTHVKNHEGYPFFLNVSLFERLVINMLEFAVLKQQRRMIGEIRRILSTIYGKTISDHPSMADPEVRPPVPGMGGVDSWFFTHEYPEGRDELMSTYNQKEADLIVGFFEYLVYNGTDESKITCLTFYNSQRKTILKGLRNNPNLAGRLFKVATVDSYQGEENDIILLSLVRSNDEGKIGFLSVENRVCVALSRAKRGLYIFGNGELLVGENKTWAGVVEIMAGLGPKRDHPKTGPVRRIGFKIPLECQPHLRKQWVEDGWQLSAPVRHGGCERNCDGVLPCGHHCKLRCHPFSHHEIVCSEKCSRLLSCGHVCSRRCNEKCGCLQCTPLIGEPQEPRMSLGEMLRDISAPGNTSVMDPVRTARPPKYQPALQQLPAPFAGPPMPTPARPAMTTEIRSRDVSDPVSWSRFAQGGVVRDDAERIERHNTMQERQRGLHATDPNLSAQQAMASSSQTLQPVQPARGADGRRIWREKFRAENKAASFDNLPSADH